MSVTRAVASCVMIACMACGRQRHAGNCMTPAAAAGAAASVRRAPRGAAVLWDPNRAGGAAWAPGTVQGALRSATSTP